MTALDASDWLGELEDEQRRRLHHAWVASGVVHLVLVASLAIAPDPAPFAMPQSITVDLVASIPMPPAPAAAPKPDKPAPAPPAPAVAPPMPKVKLLPKDAPTPTAQPKPKPKPEVKPEVVRRERPKEMSYEDALAQLRSDVGESAPPIPAPQKVAEATPQAAAAPASTSGVVVAPEVAAWNLAVMRHIRSQWPVPPEFRDSGLDVQIVIDVAADGAVLGEPNVVRSSGNPYFDDNAVRSVFKSSPLPVPPKAGKRTLIFRSEE